MASKIVELSGIGKVTLVKSPQNRSIRLSVSSRGVRVSLPRWTPYAVALAFTKQHSDWIAEQRQLHTTVQLQEGQRIGKLHTIHFTHVTSSHSGRVTVTATRLVIPLRPHENSSDIDIQAKAQKAALRALSTEARLLLPPRVQELAEKYSQHYTAVSVKQLKRRWGSCDSKQQLTFNIFLVQLSWQQIEYVICHELAHTRHMNHSADFWREVERMMPDARMIAKKVRYTQPALVPTQRSVAVED